MTHDNLVVVPPTPGPLRPLHRGRREPDDLDAIVEEVFGADDDAGPGWFDLALLLAGAGLTTWGVAGGSRLVVVAGVCACILGAVLPLRWGWRQLSARRHHRRSQQAGRSGALLAVDHPAVAELASRYDNLVELVDRPDHDLLAAAHLAVQEVASLLDGRAPHAEAELRYVKDRSDGLARLAAVVARRPPDDDVLPERQAVVDARLEVDRLAGTGSSLHRIAELTADQDDG